MAVEEARVGMKTANLMLNQRMGLMVSEWMKHVIKTAACGLEADDAGDCGLKYEHDLAHVRRHFPQYHSRNAGSHQGS